MSRKETFKQDIHKIVKMECRWKKLYLNNEMPKIDIKISKLMQNL